MSEQQPEALPSWFERMPLATGSISADAEATLRKVTAEVLTVQDVTIGKDKPIMRFRGQLMMPADEAFKRLRPLYEAVKYTPHLRHENGLDVIRALPIVWGKGTHKVNRVALYLLIATIFSVFLTYLMNSFDLINYVALKTGADPAEMKVVCDMPLASFPEIIPTDAGLIAALGPSALFALAMLGILGTHEMGHYIAARINKVFTTLPYFIPLPVLSPFGTLGAVIMMNEPAPNRRVQFDIGIAGPLAGLIVALPVMYLGLQASTVQTLQEALVNYPAALRPFVPTISEGQSLLYLGMKYLVFGKVLPLNGLDVWISPVAYAAWAGFLVTALNLMPAGQLDGGHVIYGLFGMRAGSLRKPLMAILGIMAAAGLLREMGVIDLGFGWSGWALWVLIIHFLMREPAPVLDEITGLDTRRKLLGVLTLIIFVLIFTPTPLVFNIPACPEAAPTGPTAMMVLSHVLG